MRAHAAAFCLGVWVMGTVCVSVVAMQDFCTVDRLLTTSSNEAFAGMVEDFGREDSRNFLRYLASELNRLFFRLWNLAPVRHWRNGALVAVEGPSSLETSRASHWDAGRRCVLDGLGNA